MSSLILYSTLGCHLCDEAMTVVEPLLEASGYVVNETDISESQSLFDCYALRIPVLYRSDIQLELDWPFDTELVKAFLAVTA